MNRFLLVVACLAAFVIVVVSLSAERGFFRPRYRLVAHFENVLGLQANAAAMRMELASHNAKGMPSINLEVEGLTNTYMDTGAESDVEVKGMVVMRHRLYDGGKRHNEALQIETRVRQFEYRHRQQMDDLEADLRQYYRAISSSRSPTSTASKRSAASESIGAPMGSR